MEKQKSLTSQQKSIVGISFILGGIILLIWAKNIAKN